MIKAMQPVFQKGVGLWALSLWGCLLGVVSLQGATSDQPTVSSPPAVRKPSKSIPLTSADRLLPILEKENAVLEKRWVTITNLESQLHPLQLHFAEQRTRLETEWKETRQQLEKLGLNRVLAEVLLDRYRRLPSLVSLNRTNRWLRMQISEVAVERFQVDEELKRFADLDEAIRWWLRRMAREHPELEFRPEIVSLDPFCPVALKRLQWLEQLSQAYGQILNLLYGCHAELTQLIRLVKDYRAFLAQNLIWTPNGRPIGWTTLRDFSEAIRWVIRTRSAWMETLRAYLRLPPILTFLGLVVALVLEWRRSRWEELMAKWTRRTRRAGTDSAWWTVAVLGLEALLAARWVVPLECAAWELGRVGQATEQGKALADALWWAGWLWFGIGMLRRWSRPEGLFERHFRVSSESLQLLRKVLPRAGGFIAGTAFLVIFWEELPYLAFRLSIGRFCFLAAMAVGGWLVWRLGSPASGLLAGRFRTRPESWGYRLRHVWFGALVLIPLGFAGLSLVGYHYTALVLTRCVVESVWMLVGIWMIYAMGMRWIRVWQRRLAWRKALERHREREKESPPPDASAESTETTPMEGLPQVEEPEMTLTDMGRQAQQFLALLVWIGGLLGLWWIWSSVLPALGYLDRIQLWHVSETVGGQTLTKPITLLRLLSALVTLGTTWIVSRNLPGLAELFVLQHLPLQPGSRYAIKTISQYIIVLIGLIVVSNLLGVNWSQLGWIVAAMSVGLGFGLQEVVANFVSGLLLLLERPIRVGDIVTVGCHRDGPSDSNPGHYDCELGSARVDHSEQRIHHRSGLKLDLIQYDQPHRDHCRGGLWE